MLNQFSRTQLLFGKEAMEKLAGSRVAVFGIGGVGGYTVEALVRSGVGAIDLIDDDKVCLTNLNRQIIATRSTVGKYKVDVMKERILDINPKVEVNVHKCFYLPETKDEFDFSQYSYVVDAVDTVTAKIQLVMEAKEAGVPIISSMGAGNKLDPTAFEVADIYKTSVCPLAKVMRRELKKRGVKKLKVVYSKEQPTRPIEDMSISCRTNCICPPGAAHKCTERRDIPGSTAFVCQITKFVAEAHTLNSSIKLNGLSYPVHVVTSVSDSLRSFFRKALLPEISPSGSPHILPGFQKPYHPEHPSDNGHTDIISILRLDRQVPVPVSRASFHLQDITQ